MKIVMDDGQEVAIDSLQPIIIDGNKKAIITIKSGGTSIYMHDVLGALNEFFGVSNWTLTTSDLVVSVKEVSDE